MRKSLVGFLCFVSLTSYATDYYVSSSGNDSSNGLSSSTPWQTISKVNSVFSSLNPGDRILFRRGDRFYGSLQISRSGSSGSPITISAYGSGAVPVISGFTTISGWTSRGGGIYSAPVNCESNPNMVTVNDINTPIGRWPNTGVLTIDSHSSNTSITDAGLPSSPDWTGAEVVIRKNAYIWDRNKITDHSGSTLYYTSGSYYDATNGFGYFIQNSLNTLDQTGEWYYDGSTFYMYFGSAGPGSSVVKVSTIDQLAVLLNRSYITFDNIEFEGANLNAVQISNSGNITIQNCIFNFTGRTAIYGPWNGDSPYCRINNNKISNSNNCAIYFMGDHTNATITSNTISNTGLIVGMGGSGDGTYNAIAAYGDASLVQYNIIENSGYMGIHFSGNNTNITNNYVNKFNLLKNDGGGIYTYVGTGTATSGQKVVKNVVLNGAGYGVGDPDNSLVAFGIYMDDRVRNVTVTENSVAYCSAAGIYIHNAHEIEISKNTLFDNGSGEADFGAQILFVHDGYSPDDPIRNLNVNNNIFFARTTAEKVLSFSTASNDIASLGSSDYNCFAKPIDNSYVARTWSGGWNSVATNRSLSNWQSFTGMDRNSYISPVAVTDLNKIRFEYNPTNSNKVVTLGASYIDCKGSKYPGSITLLPYSSAALILDPNSATTPPAPPVYVSSAIENAAPTKLVMTYNLSLANVIPAVSAFAVKVNSIARTVSSVAVSGTKVTLTLSSPVISGNNVTVAYTKPSTNPLQTTSGGQAATIGAQAVANNVTPVATTPVPPVYVSSVIENAAPTKLVITYNLSLANVVPAVSAFAVKVNSVARSVSSVAVSGTKVTLTLSSPVLFGNTITAAYTKPSTNPLQTTSGGQAATIGAQTVTNNVIAIPAPAPTLPVYVSSAIENAAPTKLVMTYNISLANVIPAVSAFSVKVNSAAVPISSVAVSGTKVTLTLSSPVVYGNTVTVAYSKPSSNPLQTTSGGQAATITAQTVTNRVSAVTALTENINAPPIVVVTSQPYTYSGFQGTLNASGSYDPNNDKLSFSWVAPKNIPVSNIEGSVLNFLSPVVAQSKKIEFTLTVSDGQTTEVKVIPVELLPYQPELQVAEVINIEASGFQNPYYPHNIIDGDIGTMWAANGDEQWIIMELKDLFSVQHIKLAFQPGQTQEAYFDIYGSEDKETWELILTKSRSCAFSGNLQVFEFPASKTGKEFKYVKFVGHGNLANTWNYISEFRIFGKNLRNPSDFDKQVVKVYPNPATSYTNIRIDDQNFSPDYLRIISLAGKIVMEEELDPAIREFQLSLDLIKGIYIIQMGKGSVTMFTQKLIVSK